LDVLQLDVSGRPQAWISPREAAVLYASDGVAWTLGRAFQVLRGGIQRTTGPAVAHRGAPHHRRARRHPQPGLAPGAGSDQPQAVRARPPCVRLLRRSFHFDELTREHIVPVSRGGRDSWMNCITACRACNGRKGNRMPEEAHMSCCTCPTCPACTKT
jgi:hypothetical protein